MDEGAAAADAAAAVGARRATQTRIATGSAPRAQT
jgi:hypothetical protein